MLVGRKRTRVEIGAEIKRLRKECNMTQLTLGMKLHIDQAKISKLESGNDVTLDIDILMDICDLFKISLDELCFIIDDDEAEKDAKEAYQIIRNLLDIQRKTVMDMLRGLKKSYYFFKLIVIKICRISIF